MIAETPNIGEESFTVGNPQGLTQTLSKGIISGFRENRKYIQTTTEITYGSSGAPLFNRNGEVIGITTGGFGEANLNYAISIKEVPLSNLFAENNVSSNTYNKGDIEELLDNYYTFLMNDNFVQLERLYAPKLKRYFNTFNISSSEAVKRAKNYDSKFKIISKNISIRWNTLKVEKDNQGNVTVEYIIDYSLKRNDSNNQQNYVINMIIEINYQGKIYSIYENILQRK